MKVFEWQGWIAEILKIRMIKVLNADVDKTGHSEDEISIF
jgi:hypothetical protein